MLDPRRRLTILLGAALLAIGPALAGPAVAADPPSPPPPPHETPVVGTGHDGAGVSGPGRSRTDLAEVPEPVVGNAPLGDYGCVWSSGVHHWNATADVMRDHYNHLGFASYDVGDAGNVNWTLDPYNHPSWRWGLHSLGWIARPLADAGTTGDPALLERVVTIVKDWVADNRIDGLAPQALEARAHRSHALICLRDVIGNEPWLVAALQDHARLLISEFSGYWNHGLDESLALFGIGCELGDAALADVAMGRIEDMAPVIVDAQGAANEQSVGYQQYNYRRLVDAQAKLEACGRQLPPELQRRRDLMPLFLAHATKPDGTLTQIGDTEEVPPGNIPGSALEYAATRGASGAPPADRVAVYQAGYVFGRGAWSPFGSSSHYSLRFGPPRQIHGHVDHMSVTYFSRGRNILTEAGHVGYERGPRRDWVRSSTAHNVLTMPGLRESHVTTRLTRSYVGNKADFFEVQNDGYPGRRRTRSVLVVHDPQVMVVLDRATSTTVQQFQQLWHLPADMNATVLSRGVATATPTAGSTRIWLIQVPLAGQVLPRGSTQVVRGQTTPSIQGFVAPRAYMWNPAPTVTMSRIGNATTHLTLIIPTRLNGKVSYSMTRGSDGWYRLVLDVAGKTTTLRISAGGWMSAG